MKKVRDENWNELDVKPVMNQTDLHTRNSVIYITLLWKKLKSIISRFFLKVTQLPKNSSILYLKL